VSFVASVFIQQLIGTSDTMITTNKFMESKGIYPFFTTSLWVSYMRQLHKR